MTWSSIRLWHSKPGRSTRWCQMPTSTLYGSGGVISACSRKCRSSDGTCACRLGSRRISQALARSSITLTCSRTTGGAALLPASRSALSMLSSAARTCSASRAPALVGVIRLPVRWNSLVPRLASSPRIWWLMALCVRASSSAAREKLRWRVAASSARSACSGGRWTGRWAGLAGDLAMAVKFYSQLRRVSFVGLELPEERQFGPS
ncbi:hypothetical protein D9M72_267190 [compost metagenome]